VPFYCIVAVSCYSGCLLHVVGGGAGAGAAAALAITFPASDDFVEAAASWSRAYGDGTQNGARLGISIREESLKLEKVRRVTGALPISNDK